MSRQFQISNKFHFGYWKFKPGFTLIELLVVIGILGILAAALIATIDPFEQLKKANDATAKNIVAEFVDATTRYYGNHNAYPWDDTSFGGGGCNSATAPSSQKLVDGTSVWECVTTLIDDGEIKSTFKNATSALKAVVVNGGTDTTPVQACYQPQSKTGQKDPNTKFMETGVEDSGCKSQVATGGKDCYYCAQ